MNFHVFDMKHFKNKKEKDLLNGLEVFNPDAIVMAWTHSLQGDVQQLLDGNEPGIVCICLLEIKPCGFESRIQDVSS